MRKVVVRTGARLHLGFYSFLDAALGRAYGGIGVAIERPFVEVAAWRCSSLEVECSDDSVRSVAREVLEALDARLCISFRSYIPRHVGLGSTTQTVLSVVMAASRALGIDVDPWEAAAAFGRGPVSGIGVATFLLGGLVVDSGARLDSLRRYPLLDSSDIPKPIARIELPPQWRFVIVIPRRSRGLEEHEELPLLSKPRELDYRSAYALLRETFLRLLPAAARGDAASFGAALTRIQEIVGEYFSSAQGGVFAEPYGSRIAEILRRCGSLCVGQSSWGPAMYGLSGDPKEASRLAACAERLLRELGIDAEVIITAPRNRGFELVEE
ncbi:MAG: GHMP kinase [Crenarchaeota archaeon]|nr:GHMP kinase [Thermoproteota archaeon]